MLEGFAGQEVALRLVANALQRDEVPHAYLVAGPRWLGKRRAALSLGRLLACHAPRLESTDGPTPCGECRSCVLPFGPGTHHDLVVIEPEAPPAKTAATDEASGEASAESVIAVASGVIRVEQIRDAERRLSRSLVAGRRRVCVVPDAERMCRVASAGNAFLKTLEEPPPHTAIVLTASNPADLLPTIVSRCLMLPFHPLSAEQLARAMCWVEGGAGVAESEAALAAALSCGRLGLAELMVREPGLRQVRDRVLTILRESWLGGGLGSLRGPEEVHSLCVEWWTRTAGAGAAGELGATGRERAVRAAAPELLAFMEGYIRDVMAFRVGARSGLQNPDRAEDVAADAQRFSPEGLIARLRALARTRRALAANASSRLALEVALARMRNLPR